MLTILPPITGKSVDKLYGKGAVVILSNENAIVMVPTKVNGTPNCIILRIYEATNEIMSVSKGMSMAAQMRVVRNLEDAFPASTLFTLHGFVRDLDKSWLAASMMLEAAGNAALLQAAADALAKTAKKPKKK